MGRVSPKWMFGAKGPDGHWVVFYQRMQAGSLKHLRVRRDTLPEGWTRVSAIRPAVQLEFYHAHWDTWTTRPCRADCPSWSRITFTDRTVDAFNRVAGGYR